MNENLEDIEKKVNQYVREYSVTSLIQEANKKGLTRITLDINKMRETYPDLAEYLIKYPLKLIPIIENQINALNNELKGEKQAIREKIATKRNERLYINIRLEFKA